MRSVNNGPEDSTVKRCTVRPKPKKKQLQNVVLPIWWWSIVIPGDIETSGGGRFSEVRVSRYSST